MPLSAVKPSAKLLAIAWPIFVEQALRMLIGTVDTFLVSHISDGAVAGLSVAHQIVVFFLIAFNFVGVGTSVVITHYLGGRDRKGADQIATNAIAINTWLGLICSIAVFVFAAPMLRLMQLPPELMDYALPFLALMGGTLFMESMNMSIAAVLRAHKYTRDAMYVAIGQNVINVIGASILLFGLFGAPKMGVVGVALASVFSRCCACVASWILLDYRIKLRLRVLDFIRISWSKVGRVLRIGLPAAGENMCYWTAFMVVTTFTARLGGDNLAVQSYALNIQRLVMLFSISIGLGTEILIGHLIGAGEFEEAYRELLRSLRTGFIIATSVILAVAAAAPWLMGIFTENSSIIATGTMLLWISVLLEPGRVFNVVVINSLRATGDVGFPIKMAVLSMWCVWVPLAWLLGLQLHIGIAGMWIAMAIDEWLRGVLMYRRWKRRDWLPHAQRSRAHVVPGPDPEPAAV